MVDNVTSATFGRPDNGVIEVSLETIRDRAREIADLADALLRREKAVSDRHMLVRKAEVFLASREAMLKERGKMFSDMEKTDA